MHNTIITDETIYLIKNNASNQLAKEKQKTTRFPCSYSSYANSHNVAIIKYVTNVSTMSKSTAYEYYARLSNFEIFVSSEYKTSVDHLIRKIKEGFADPYDLLSDYCGFLQNNGNISISTLNQRVVTAKNFLEYCDVDISPRKFEIKVKLPKSIRKNKEALSKEDIIEILNACSDIRLKTYVIFLASTGCRAVEALSIRYVDLNLDTNPAKVLIRGEYTKTRVDRSVFLTAETAKQLKLWLEYKHRTRRVCYKDTGTGKTTTEYRTPTQDPNNLIFAVYQKKTNPIPDYLYGDFRAAFAKTLDRIGKDSFEDNKRRRKITLHSFRRFVKSTISDLGYADFSEYFIGHSGSTYYRKTDKEKVEIFRKIEPYLTFLDFATLERKGSDTQARIEGLEAINQTLRQKDSMNTDAISTLSDRLSKVMQEIEILKRQR
ncbi:MAG: site-specific integrase [Nitrososphaeraceae archaeon]|nr:site-specific integrase [Nitrososphaeraceae archaeon]MDW0314109.1 site-specific integrase [Nitrososphaeraceae archaeon]MDW0332205.1 site-specific integrase [Nitrososphaeraceae archaeon]